MNPLSFIPPEDLVYAGLLLTSFSLSWLLRGPLSQLRTHGGIIGFAMACILLQWKVLCSLPIALFTLACIKFAPRRHLTKIVFVVSFAHLLCVRHLHYLFNTAELKAHANGVQLFMTLRVIGLVFEINDGGEFRKGLRKIEPGKIVRFLDREPTLYESFNYLYHFCGLFTGPYYSYQMLLDSYDVGKDYDPLPEVKTRFIRLLWSVPMFAVTHHFFPLNDLRSDTILAWSFHWSLFRAATCFIIFRGRVYSAWAISESVCVALGIGVYPAECKPRVVLGPSDLDSFKKLHGKPGTTYCGDAVVNIDIYEVEFSDGFRSGMRSWNKSVQSWLALHVHTRLPRAFRVEATMFVSALWHGTYGGYFMSFLIVPMCTEVEDILFKLVPASQETGRRPAWFQLPYTFLLRCRGFDFLSLGPLLRNYKDTHRAWTALNYWLLFLVGPIYLASKIYGALKPRGKREKPVEPKKTD